MNSSKPNPVTPIVFFVPASRAFVEHNTDAKIIAIKPFERGYYPIRFGGGRNVTAEDLNRGRFPDDVLQSAVEASIFGWHTPAARPAIAFIEAAEKAEAMARAGVES